MPGTASRPRHAPVAVFVGAWLVLSAIASLQVIFGGLAAGIPIHPGFLKPDLRLRVDWIRVAGSDSASAR